MSAFSKKGSIDLNSMSEAASPGAWSYRPGKYDDWGVIRVDPDDDLPDGQIVATTRHVKGDDDFDEHRRNNTDPFAANGKFVSELVNRYRSGDLVPKKIKPLEWSPITEDPHDEDCICKTPLGDFWIVECHGVFEIIRRHHSYNGWENTVLNTVQNMDEAKRKAQDRYDDIVRSLME